LVRDNTAILSSIRNEPYKQLFPILKCEISFDPLEMENFCFEKKICHRNNILLENVKIDFILKAKNFHHKIARKKFDIGNRKKIKTN